MAKSEQLQKFKELYPDVDPKFLESLHNRLFDDSGWVNAAMEHYSKWENKHGFDPDWYPVMMTVVEIYTGSPERVEMKLRDPDEPTKVTIIAYPDYSS